MTLVSSAFESTVSQSATLSFARRLLMLISHPRTQLRSKTPSTSVTSQLLSTEYCALRTTFGDHHRECCCYYLATQGPLGQTIFFPKTSLYATDHSCHRNLHFSHAHYYFYTSQFISYCYTSRSSSPKTIIHGSSF